jgi:hypothetical protein
MILKEVLDAIVPLDSEQRVHGWAMIKSPAMDRGAQSKKWGDREKRENIDKLLCREDTCSARLPHEPVGSLLPRCGRSRSPG